jgi:1-acyl-sn-glycerol-3-phosphate acyltransferase
VTSQEEGVATTSVATQSSSRVATFERWLDAIWPRLDTLRSLYKPYVEGLETLPVDGRFLLVGNHTVAGNEALLIPYEVRRQIGKTVRPLADRNFGKMKGLPADVITAFGAIVGTPEGTRELMRANEPILVFPGGGREIGKGKDELYALLWGERAGFARLAVEHNYPIVPAALVGGDDVYKILTTSHGLWGRLTRSVGQRLGGRTDMTVHLMRGVGPTLIPNPQRMYLRFGAPIDTTKPKGVSTEKWVASVRDNVKTDLESDLADLLRIRETDPYRQLAPWAWHRAVMPKSTAGERESTVASTT